MYYIGLFYLIPCLYEVGSIPILQSRKLRSREVKQLMFSIIQLASGIPEIRL